MNRVYVITFYTHHDALTCFRALQEKAKAGAACTVELIPVPRELSSSCGTAVKAICSDCESVPAELVCSTGEYEAFCELIDNHYLPVQLAEDTGTGHDS